MMKTGLSIIQNFLYRNNLDVPSTLSDLGSSTDPAVLQLVHLLYEVCEHLRQQSVWDVQKKRYSFSTVSGQETYVLPEDYYSPIFNTHYNQSEDSTLVGPVSDAQFNWYLHGATGSSTNYSYRIFGGDQNPNSSTASASNSPYRQFEVKPSPSSAQTLSFDYISRDLFKPQNWLPSTGYNGSVTPVRVNSAGYNYTTTSNGTSSTVAPSGESNFTDNDITWTWLGRTPYETLNASTDLCIFDYDLVTLGLEAAWFEAKKGEFGPKQIAFERRVNKAVARYKGSYIGSLCGGSVRPAYNIPYRNWSY